LNRWVTARTMHGASWDPLALPFYISGRYVTSRRAGGLEPCRRREANHHALYTMACHHFLTSVAMTRVDIALMKSLPESVRRIGIGGVALLRNVVGLSATCVTHNDLWRVIGPGATAKCLHRGCF
jgi:hypothetical protein